MNQGLISSRYARALLEFADAEGVADLKIAVHPAPGAKCERCWQISESVGKDAEHSTLCGRCAAVVRELGA